MSRRLITLTFFFILISFGLTALASAQSRNSTLQVGASVEARSLRARPISTA